MKNKEMPHIPGYALGYFIEPIYNFLKKIKNLISILYEKIRIY